MTEKKKISGSNRIIIVVVAALIVLLGVFTALNRQDTGLDGAEREAQPTPANAGGSFSVIADGKTLKTYSIDDLRSFPFVEVEKTIESGSKADESGQFKGTPLEALLDDAAVGWRDRYDTFVFRAEDGFVSSVFASDLETDGNVLIVYEKDGEPIPDSGDGGKGPLRALVVADPFGNRSAQMLTSVELNSSDG
jgi:DMSO/TMAO reductase YedYZ molybdopterin-dependent catalytic subunit